MATTCSAFHARPTSRQIRGYTPMPMTASEEALLKAALKASHRDAQIDMADPLPQREISCGDPVGDLFRLLMSGQPITAETLAAAGVPLPPGYSDQAHGGPQSKEEAR